MTTTSPTAPSSAPSTHAFDESLWRSAWTKATFLLFCWLSYFIFAALAGLVYYLVHPRLLELHPVLDLSVLVLIGLVLFIVGAGLFLITATALSGMVQMFSMRALFNNVKISPKKEADFITNTFLNGVKKENAD